MSSFLELITRLIRWFINENNRNKEKQYTDDPANTISNGGRVQQSDKTFTELAEQAKRDPTK